MANWRRLAFLVLIGAAGVSGCRHAKSPLKLTYVGEKGLDYYKEAATEVEYPNVMEPSDSEVRFSEPPRRIRHPRKDEIRDITLAETIHIALDNAEIIRTRGGFRSPNNTVLTNPNIAASIYDPAIQESNTGFGQSGVEAALSDFDAQFSTNVLWGSDERIPNTPFDSSGQRPGSTFLEDTGQFQSQLQKQMATGGQLSVIHNWNYSWNNGPSRLFPSAFTGVVQGEYRHPLWAGRGTEFTRIAGPINNRTTLGRATTVNQGVVIARINNDISISDFEANVRNLLKDVEDLYWDLALAYRRYDAEIVTRNSTLQTWREVKARYTTGSASASEEAQARDSYFDSRSRTETALGGIYELEGELRRLIGLPVNDGQVLRPLDEPVTAEFVPDWHVCLTEALTRRVELRRQKWNIKSLDLQLRAAHSLTRPRLDFVSQYRVNAFGDQLFGQDDDDGIPPTVTPDGIERSQGLRSAFETLTQGNQTGWQLGFEFSMPIGFRAAHSQVRNIELQLAKARAALAAQELEVSHELGRAFQELDREYTTAITNFNRRRAAERRVRAAEAEYKVGRTSVDLVLRAQQSLAAAEVAYYQSLINYNKAVTDIHYRKGTLLEQDGVHLAEGLWEPRAYADALRRAWDRSFAFNGKHLKTEPEEFALDGPLESTDMMLPQPRETGLYPQIDQSVLPPPPSAPMQQSPSNDDDPAVPAAPPRPRPLSGESAGLEPVPPRKMPRPSGDELPAESKIEPAGYVEGEDRLSAPSLDDLPFEWASE